MKWFVLWLCLTGILTTVWIVGFCEGKKRMARSIMKKLEDISIHDAIMFMPIVMSKKMEWLVKYIREAAE